MFQTSHYYIIRFETKQKYILNANLINFYMKPYLTFFFRVDFLQKCN